jgi:hypothetical protein
VEADDGADVESISRQEAFSSERPVGIRVVEALCFMPATRFPSFELLAQAIVASGHPHPRKQRIHGWVQARRSVDRGAADVLTTPIGVWSMYGTNIQQATPKA